MPVKAQRIRITLRMSMRSDCKGAAEFALRAKLIEIIEVTTTHTLPANTGIIYGEEHVVIEKKTVQVGTVEIIDTPNQLQPRFAVHERNSQGDEDKITVAVNLGSKDVEGPSRSQTFVEIKLSELDDDISEGRLRSVINRGTKCVKWARRPRA